MKNLIFHNMLYITCPILKVAMSDPGSETGNGQEPTSPLISSKGNR